MAVRQYVEGLPDAAELLDVLAVYGGDDTRGTTGGREKPALYPEESYIPHASPGIV